jgi:NADH-quinone oxidoreductase subunit H
MSVWEAIISVCFGLIRILVIILPLLIAVALATLVERKVIGSMQKRRGPNVVGLFGILQPFADAAKLIFKETVIPSAANRVIFLLAPIITLTLSLLGWGALPFAEGVVIADLNVGLLYIFAVSSLGVYGIIMSGWSSNSRYAFLGSLRSAAQMVSYEVSIGLIVINVLMCAGTMNLSGVVFAQEYIWFGLPLFFVMGLFFISVLAETNRAPFDLPEAEAELVAGYFVEYSSMTFALFFIAEYGSMLVMSSLISVLFLGGWTGIFSGVLWFSLKVCFFLFGLVWVRAAFPRYRYDQLMRLGWKVFLPLSLGWVVLVSGSLLLLDSL